MTTTRSAAIAGACSLLALATRLTLDPILGMGQAYSFALGGVGLTLYLASWRAAIFNAVLSAAWVNYFYVLPRYEYEGLLNRPLVAGLLSYLIIAAMLIYFGARAAGGLAKQMQANEVLRQADKQKDQFISVLSHELRNPLGAISNATMVIRERSRNRDVEPAAELLHRQVEQMRRLLDDLLDVARISRGLVTLHREIQDVRVCVQTAIDANMHLLDTAQQSLNVRLPDAPVTAWIDGPRITQIVSNLINNATKYAGVGARIEVRLEGVTDVRITVRDNGTGLKPELLPNLFERFYANATERSIHGLGLGLWISQRLAVMHGGSITVVSSGAGEGAEFQITLPARHVTLPAMASATPPRC